MKQPMTTTGNGSATPRSERRTAALVTEYIHELSGRHGSPAADISRPSDRFAIRDRIAR